MRSLSINDDAVYDIKAHIKKISCVERTELTSNTIYSFIRRMHRKTNERFRW